MVISGLPSFSFPMRAARAALPAPQVGPLDQVTISSDPLPTSAEFKLLLKPAGFEDAEAGVERYWKMVKRTADELGLAGTQDNGTDGERSVSFLDTEGFQLKAEGYLLRVRQDEDLELTLKYRSTDRDEVASKDLSSTLPGETKFEMDVTRRDLYSKSTTVEVDELPEDLAACRELFPGLAQVDLPEEPLKTVNGRRVHERSFKLGKVTLPDGAQAKAGMSMWYDQDRVLLAEFSFRIPLEDGQSDSEPAARLLLEALRERSSVLEGTKTDFIYGT